LSTFTSLTNIAPRLARALEKRGIRRILKIKESKLALEEAGPL